MNGSQSVNLTQLVVGTWFPKGFTGRLVTSFCVSPVTFISQSSLEELTALWSLVLRKPRDHLCQLTFDWNREYVLSFQATQR